MKHAKQILSLLLTVSLMTASLASCGNPETEQDSPEAAQGTAAEPSVETEAETEPETSDTDLLPEADYDGYVFNILSTSPDYLWGYQVSIWAEEETGEPLNDFVFRRNVGIEERYNITIENSANLDSGPTSALALKTVQAGDDTYSIMTYGVKWQLVDVQRGGFMNLHTVDSIDLAHPWWNGEAAELLTIKDRLYMAFSSFNTFDNEALPAIYVNNDMIANHNLESPYDLVLSGDWTLDKIYEMASSVVMDLDGDGVVSEGDVFGFIGGIGTYNMMFTATNQPHIRIGEDGRYILNQGTEGSLAAAEKIWRIVDDTTVSAYQNTQGWCVNSFKEGDVLFFNAGVANLNGFRDLEFNLGMVPVPKMDTAQESYRTMYSNQSMTVMIPSTTSDPERTGVICEAFGAYSRIPIQEVYIETILKKKAARDEETARMLDILINTKCIDVGVLNENSWSTVISSYFNTLHDQGPGQLASAVAANKTLFEKMTDKIEQAYEKLD